MLTDEQIKAIRERCEANEGYVGKANGDRDIYQLVNEDIPALLEEIRELKAEINERLGMISCLKEAVDKLKADRNQWKRRAEALEQAIHGHCKTCVHEGESISDDSSPCFEYGLTPMSGVFPNCEHYEFDEARFAEGKE